MRKTVLAVALVLSAFAGLAAADSREYVQGNAGVGVSLSITYCDNTVPPPDALPINFGGVRFCVGHVLGDANGDNALTISDDAISPVSAVYCQDFNANAICGEGNVPPDGNRIEPRTTFCGSVILDSPVDPTPRPEWVTSNWDTEQIILVFISSPGTGNAAVSPCGTLYSGGTHGFVSHI